MNKLFVLIGAPGSGKTTYAKKYLLNDNTVYVSRDEVRFSLLKEGEEYFSREKEVYREFIWKIYNAIQNEHKDVIADATHLNDKSRAKLFSSLPLDFSKIDVIGVYFNTPLNTCLERNNTRKGTKTYVPDHQVRKMFFSLKKPTYDEYNGVFNNIYVVNNSIIPGR